MLKKWLAITVAVMLMLTGLAMPASAAPTRGQIDFVSRMSQKGLCVSLGSYIYYAQDNAIYRMTTSAKSQKKLYTVTAARDLQIYGGYIYYVDEDTTKKTHTLYRFKPGNSKVTKLIDDVYDFAIGGYILYYTNAAGDTVTSWNLKTDKKRTMYSKLFTGTHDINYMQNMLTFTAKMNNSTKNSLFIYSLKSDNATYYEGMEAEGMLAQGDYIYMPDAGDFLRMKFDVSKPTLAVSKTMIKSVKRAVIAGSYMYYWKESGDTATIVKRSISTGKESSYFQYSLKEYPTLYLEPASSSMWIFANNEAKGDYFVKRLAK